MLYDTIYTKQQLSYLLDLNKPGTSSRVKRAGALARIDVASKNHVEQVSTTFHRRGLRTRGILVTIFQRTGVYCLQYVWIFSRCSA